MATSKLRAVVEVEGDTVAADKILEMAARAYKTAPLMAELVGYLEEVSRERVENGDYAPLTDGTVARKESQGEDTGIFRDEWRPINGSPTRQGDMLYRALTVSGAPGQIRYSTRTWAVFGVESKGHGPLFYARFVQNVKGTKRRILAISGEQAQVIVNRTMSYIIGGTTKYTEG